MHSALERLLARTQRKPNERTRHGTAAVTKQEPQRDEKRISAGGAYLMVCRRVAGRAVEEGVNQVWVWHSPVVMNPRRVC